MKKKKYTGIILAAGNGKRMMSEIPKQYIVVNDRPLLYYSLKAFEESCVDEIVLVVPAGDVSYVRDDIVTRYGFKKVTKIVHGGKERIWSVKNGLMEAEGTYVLIHDSARAFVSVDLINRMAEAAAEYHAAVAAVPAKDTIKVADKKGFVKKTPDRSKVWVVQTPQAFKKKKLIDAYKQLESKETGKVSYTDDAGIMEASGNPVKLILGEYTNIKITTPDDIKIAESFLD